MIEVPTIPSTLGALLFPFVIGYMVGWQHFNKWSYLFLDQIDFTNVNVNINPKRFYKFSTQKRIFV